MSEITRRRVTRILVVEDSEPTRNLIEICLGGPQTEITSRGDGLSGLNAALNSDFDLLILDIALPGIDGWEVLRQIRSDPHRSKLPVIVVTAHHDTVVREQSPLAQSVDGFLGKPFDIQDLAEIVDRIITDTAATRRLEVAP